MKYFLYLSAPLLASCGNDACDCRQLKEQNGIYSIVSPDDEEAGLLAADYLNKKDAFARLSIVNVNNPLLANDSLSYYEKQKDTAGMVRQYIKMLRAKELPERNNAVYEAIFIPGIKTEYISISLPVTAIFKKAQSLIRDKSSYTNCLFYQALLGCMTPLDYAAITEKIYWQDRPLCSELPQDPKCLYEMEKREGHFFLANGESNNTRISYLRAIRLSEDFSTGKQYNKRIADESKILKLLIDYIYNKTESEHFAYISYDFSLQGELNYMRGLYAERKGNQAEAQTYFKTAYEKTNDEYLRLIISTRMGASSTLESLENLGRQGTLYEKIEKAKKICVEQYMADYEPVKALFKELKQLEQKLKEKGIDLNSIEMEDFTGSCTNEKGDSVKHFESGVLIQE